jgi:curli biogenesis system outer membrane secretion channel CsgG
MRRHLTASIALAALAACRSQPATPTPLPAADAAAQALRATARAADSVARAAIGREQAIDVARIDPRAIAVPPLAVRLADTALAPLSYALADLLMTDLSRSARLRVVERLQLAAVTRELALAGSGQVDSSVAPRVGRLVGARRLVVAALADAGAQGAGRRIALDARVAEVATARVAPAVRATAPLDDILDAEKALAFELFTTLGVTLTPAERAAVAQRPTRSLAALLAYGRAVRAEYRGDFGGAAREYRAAAAADAGFRAPRERLGVLLPVAGSGGPAPAAPRVLGTPLERITTSATDRITVWTPGGPPVVRGSTAVDPVFPLGTVTLLIRVVPP